MWFRSLFDSLTARGARGPARRQNGEPTRRRALAARPQLEALEGRCLPSFLAPVSYPVGTTPQAVVTADLSGDGKLDLITTNLGGNSISVQMGNGDGTFQAANTYGVGSAPASVAVGDFNGDGKLDLVTANDQDSTVSVLLGNGDGTFRAAQTYATGQSPVSVAVGDLNGKLDIVTANYGDNTLSVLLGNGDGTFRAAQSIVLDAPPTAVAVGDLNADGKLDLAVVHVLLGNGDGTFTAGKSYALPGCLAISVAVADMNADGKLDLVTANDDGNKTASVLLLGYGDGTFQGPTSFSTGSYYTCSLAVADLNRDGKPDLVTANYIDCTVSVLLGDRKGSFGPADDFPVGGSHPTSLAAGDVDGDGFPDLAVVNGGSNSVSVLLNAADWPSSQVSDFPSPTSAGAPGSFTVTAKNPNGTVHFTSSDSQAVLPADYTFTAPDAGVHTFSATLKTAGTQSITATDAMTAGLTATDGGITVNPVSAGKMIVAGFPSPATAGAAGSFTVTLEDPYGNIASGYTGTVRFTSRDAKAALPANYTFNSGDAGVHTFSATLKTAGTPSLTATDTTTSSLTATDAGITVNPAAASKFILTAPASVTAGASFSLTLTAENAYGNVVTGYTGTVHFTSTDRTATLTANYTFTAADKGVHTFTGLVLRKRGTQKITLTDTLTSSLTGTVVENVL